MSRQNSTSSVNTTEDLFTAPTLTNADFDTIRYWIVDSLCKEGCKEEDIIQMVNHHRTIQRVYGPMLAFYLDRNEERKAKAKTAIKATADFILKRIAAPAKSPCPL